MHHPLHVYMLRKTRQKTKQTDTYACISTQSLEQVGDGEAERECGIPHVLHHRRESHAIDRSPMAKQLSP